MLARVRPFFYHVPIFTLNLPIAIDMCKMLANGLDTMTVSTVVNLLQVTGAEAA